MWGGKRKANAARTSEHAGQGRSSQFEKKVRIIKMQTKKIQNQGLKEMWANWR